MQYTDSCDQQARVETFRRIAVYGMLSYGYSRRFRR